MTVSDLSDVVSSLSTKPYPLAGCLCVRPADEGGMADHGWLQSAHSFSFADYHDPQHVQFENLRVINDDVVAAGKGFGEHPHRDFNVLFMRYGVQDIQTVFNRTLQNDLFEVESRPGHLQLRPLQQILQRPIKTLTGGVHILRIADQRVLIQSRLFINHDLGHTEKRVERTSQVMGNDREKSRFNPVGFF